MVIWASFPMGFTDRPAGEEVGFVGQPTFPQLGITCVIRTLSPVRFCLLLSPCMSEKKPLKSKDTSVLRIIMLRWEQACSAMENSWGKASLNSYLMAMKS